MKDVLKAIKELTHTGEQITLLYSGGPASGTLLHALASTNVNFNVISVGLNADRQRVLEDELNVIITNLDSDLMNSDIIVPSAALMSKAIMHSVLRDGGGIILTGLSMDSYRSIHYAEQINNILNVVNPMVKNKVTIVNPFIKHTRDDILELINTELPDMNRFMLIHSDLNPYKLIIGGMRVFNQEVEYSCRDTLGESFGINNYTLDKYFDAELGKYLIPSDADFTVPEDVNDNIITRLTQYVNEVVFRCTNIHQSHRPSGKTKQRSALEEMAEIAAPYRKTPKDENAKQVEASFDEPMPEVSSEPQSIDIESKVEKG